MPKLFLGGPSCLKRKKVGQVYLCLVMPLSPQKKMSQFCAVSFPIQGAHLLAPHHLSYTPESWAAITQQCMQKVPLTDRETMWRFARRVDEQLVEMRWCLPFDNDLFSTLLLHSFHNAPKFVKTFNTAVINYVSNQVLIMLHSFEPVNPAHYERAKVLTFCEPEPGVIVPDPRSTLLLVVFLTQQALAFALDDAEDLMNIVNTTGVELYYRRYHHRGRLYTANASSRETAFKLRQHAERFLTMFAFRHNLMPRLLNQYCESCTHGTRCRGQCLKKYHPPPTAALWLPPAQISSEEEEEDMDMQCEEESPTENASPTF